MWSDKFLPRREGERFFTAVAAALLLQGVLATGLSFIDWQVASGPKQEYGPVQVRLQQFDEARTEQEEPPTALPESIETDSLQRSEPAEEAPQPSTTDPPPPQEQRGDRAAGGEPQERVAPRQEEAPREERAPRTESREAAPQKSPQKMTAPAEEQESSPARRDAEAEEERSPAPEESRDQYSEGSRFEYGDTPEERTVGTAAEGAEEARPSEAGSEEESPSILDDEVFERIGPGEQRSPETTEGSGGEDGEPGEGTESGVADGTAGEGDTDGTEGSDVAVSFDSEGVKRSLQRSPIPQLSEEQLALLPPRVEVRISFRLDASGKIVSTSFVEGRKTGITEVDAQIIQAVREWRFDRKEGAPTVGGTLRIILRTGN